MHPAPGFKHGRSPSQVYQITLRSSSVGTSKYRLYTYQNHNISACSEGFDAKVREARVSCPSTHNSPRCQHNHLNTRQVMHYSVKSGTRGSATTESTQRMDELCFRPKRNAKGVFRDTYVRNTDFVTDRKEQRSSVALSAGNVVRTKR